MKSPSKSLAAVFLLLLVACGDEQKTEKEWTALDWHEASAKNEMAVNLMDQDQIPRAVEIFEELVKRTPDLYETRFNLGVGLMNSQNNDRKLRQAEMDRAEAIFRELVAEVPDRPEGHYILGVLLDYLGKDRAEIRKHYEKAHELAPFEPCAVYRIGKFWFEEGGEHLGRAEQLLMESLRLQAHLVSGWNSLYGTLRRMGEKERAAETIKLFQLYSDTEPEQGETISLVYNGMGSLGNCIRKLSHYGERTTFAAGPIRFETAADLPEGPAISPTPPVLQPGEVLHGAFELFAASFSHPPSIHDLDGNGRVEVFLPNGAEPARLVQRTTTGFEDVRVAWDLPELRGVVGGVFADVDHDGKPDLFSFGAGRNRLFLNRDGKLVEFMLPEAPPAFTVAAQIADIDHDGDLDIHVAQFIAQPPAGTTAQAQSLPFRPAADRLLSNLRPTLYDKKTSGALAFRDMRGDFLGDRSGFTTSLVWADLDDDGDLDLYRVDGSGRGQWIANDRLYRFRAQQSDSIEKALGGLVAIDVDRDGKLEILRSTWSEKTEVQVISFPRGRPYVAAKLALSAAILPHARPYPADLDNDGDVDLIFLSVDGRSQIATNDGRGSFTVEEGPRMSGHGLAFNDLDADGLLDIVFLAQDGNTVMAAMNRSERPGQALALRLRGKAALGMAATWSTRFGTGAKVELAGSGEKAWAFSQTRNGSASSSDLELHFGMADQEPRIVRILWSDFVLQSEEVTKQRPLVITEVNRKSSSCPVLFVPDGQGGFRFVTDFLGVGGLGFFMKPGEFAPPDRDETVRIGELIPLGDHYELRVHEPMEEISYLDRLSLVAVDHPIGTEVQADERLATAEPWATGRPLVLRSSFLPEAARSDAGRDCLEELSRVDRIYQPDMALSPRFVGYLEREQSLEFDFDETALRAARPAADARLVLVVEGFVEYPYSHVNYAAWEAGVTGSSLSLDRRGADGVWQPVMPELGYPAGMTRCMTVDASALLDGPFATIRLRSNLDIRIDRLRLAWALDPAAGDVHRRDFEEATLRFVGYPAEVAEDGREPKLYDYQQMESQFDWKIMGGRYTAFGDVLELVREADDRMVVMGHGEEVVLRLPVSAFPPPAPGQTRTFFLEAEGYCKDMDPYTAFPDTVGPLPHKGVIDYPFGLDPKSRQDQRVRSQTGTFR